MLRKEVDWKQASCRGLDTNIFFMTASELADKECIEVIALRQLCFACPIWKECLTMGFKHERYGTWGGVTGDERMAIRAKKHSSEKVVSLIRDCETVGFDYQRIVEISKVEKEFTF